MDETYPFPTFLSWLHFPSSRTEECLVSFFLSQTHISVYLENQEISSFWFHEIFSWISMLQLFFVKSLENLRRICNIFFPSWFHGKLTLVKKDVPNVSQFFPSFVTHRSFSWWFFVDHLICWEPFLAQKSLFLLCNTADIIHHKNWPIGFCLLASRLEKTKQKNNRECASLN